MSAARPSNDVEICNLALDLLNQKVISNIDSPTTPVAEQCARWYHPVRAALLRRHPWKFASIRTTLTSTTDYALPFGYDKAWALPNDFIRLLSLGDDVIGGNIVNDSGALCIRYIYDCETVSKFDSLFVDALVLSLALRLAPKMSASNEKVKEIREELRDLSLPSFSVDGQDRPPTKLQTSKWIRKRRAYGGLRGFGSQFVTFGEDINVSIQYQLENGFILTSLV